MCSRRGQHIFTEVFFDYRDALFISVTFPEYQIVEALHVVSLALWRVGFVTEDAGKLSHFSRHAKRQLNSKSLTSVLTPIQTSFPDGPLLSLLNLDVLHILRVQSWATWFSLRLVTGDSNIPVETKNPTFVRRTVPWCFRLRLQCLVILLCGPFSDLRVYFYMRRCCIQVVRRVGEVRRSGVRSSNAPRCRGLYLARPIHGRCKTIMLTERYLNRPSWRYCAQRSSDPTQLGEKWIGCCEAQRLWILFLRNKHEFEAPKGLDDG